MKLVLRIAIAGMMSSEKLAERTLTIAVVGDVHDAWDANDEVALKRLGVDLVLLVGDFGNESVDVVRAIAQLSIPKAIIFGNHDAWYTATNWGREKCPYDRQKENWVQQQIDLVGTAHAGYSKLDLPDLGLTVVGGRPFSWGGSEWKNKTFYREWYGIHNFEESTAQIVASAQSATEETLIFMGHCGPKGLGALPSDPCGKDWAPIGGDHGDPDLQEAIAQLHKTGKPIPLVAFGHMHHQLRHTKLHLRKPLQVDENGTVYLNAASVPRIIKTEEDCLRNFSIVTLKHNTVIQAALVWLDQDFEIQSKQLLYERE
jgi:uncharacterized protein (TIGR04168 family)